MSEANLGCFVKRGKCGRCNYDFIIEWGKG
jgi:hypothetical protein